MQGVPSDSNSEAHQTRRESHLHSGGYTGIPPTVPRYKRSPLYEYNISNLSRLDFFDTKSRFDMLPKTLQKPWRTLIIGDRVILNDIDNAFFPREIALSVRVREYGTCANDNRLVFSEGSSRSALTYYAIDRSTFPSVRQLDNWGRNLFFEESQLLGFRLYIMDKFLFVYLHAEAALPHVRISSPRQKSQEV